MVHARVRVEEMCLQVQDVFGEESVEGGEEGTIAVENHVNTRGCNCIRYVDGRDDGGENGSEAGKQVGEVNMGE